MKKVVIVFILGLFLLGCSGPAEPVSQDADTVVVPRQQEKTETGGTLEEWRDIITRNTGVDSAASQAFAECNDGMIQKIQECATKPGWIVINEMEVVAADGKRYNYQDVQADGCEGKSLGDDNPITIDTGFIDYENNQGYQILCSVQCSSWECEPAKLKTHWVISFDGNGQYDDEYNNIQYTQNGEFSFDISGSTIQGSGSGTVEILQDIGGCMGTGSFSPQYSVTGSVSGNEVTFTMSKSSPPQYILAFHCSDLGFNVESTLESPFNFEGKTVTIPLDEGISTPQMVVIPGEHGRSFAFSFTVVG